MLERQGQLKDTNQEFHNLSCAHVFPSISRCLSPLKVDYGTYIHTSDLIFRLSTNTCEAHTKTNKGGGNEQQGRHNKITRHQTGWIRECMYSLKDLITEKKEVWQHTIRLRLTYCVPFQTVTKQRSCHKKPEQALLSLWLGVWSVRGRGATEKGLQSREDKTTYGQGLQLECSHLVALMRPLLFLSTYYLSWTIAPKQASNQTLSSQTETSATSVCLENLSLSDNRYREP